MNRHSCKQCGAEFQWHDRSDKQFCDANCRKAWSRRGDRAKRGYQNIMRDLQSIRSTLKKHPDLRDDLNGKLKRIQEEVTDILRLTDQATIQEQAEKAEMLSGVGQKRESRHYLTPSEARALSQKLGN